MPPRMPDDKRASILAAIQAIADGHGDRSAADIGREHTVDKATVTKIAKAAGLDHVWQRSQTAAASRAKQIDNRSRRAALAAAMLDDAERLRQRMWEEAVVVTATGSKVLVDLPPAADARQFASALTAFVKSSLEIEARDAEQEQHAAVDAWLREVTGRAE